jgi:anthranilate/para-aminobenzoate synthase component II
MCLMIDNDDSFTYDLVRYLEDLEAVCRNHGTTDEIMGVKHAH